MESEELKKILSKHKKWLEGEGRGKRADLSRTDLRYANLRNTDLRYAYFDYANLRGADLNGADLSYASFTFADLNYADLRNTDLKGVNLIRAAIGRADLRGANIDYSAWPLWCGSISARIDDRIAKQIAYHLVSAALNSPFVSDAVKAELGKIVDLANESHLVEKCGCVGD